MDQFGIAYLLPEPAKSYHEQLCLDIENEFELQHTKVLSLAPHITLKYPSEVPSMDELDEVLEGFCQNQPKTPWSLHGFGHFKSTDQHVIFVDVDPSPEIRITHARLLEDLRKLSWIQWGTFDHAELHYHVTAACKGLTADTFENVWRYVTAHSEPDFDLYLDSLALIKIDPGSVHSIYKQYLFTV